MEGAWKEGKGGRYRGSYDLMVYDNHEFGRLTENLRVNFLSDATAKNSGEYTR